MRISENWLREWASPKMNTKALAERLTMAGLEVSAVEKAAPRLDDVVVGEIVSLSPHSDAGNLHLCRVNIGNNKTINVVCGAPNAAAGVRSPVALEGANLPGGKKVKPAAIRGVTSQGMLCSAEELGLAESSDGIMVLNENAKPGTTISDHLALDDTVLEIDLTPNRGDCLSVTGVAREVVALTGAKLKRPILKMIPPVLRDKFNVKLDASRDCPHYAGRIIRGIDSTVSTPDWLKEKLRRSGIRSIHPVVDVTNYVMLELGQPMHAFDLNKITGSIHARYAEKNETLVLLDGRKIPLNKGSLLIADDESPLALAGIMGGLSSAVDTNTQNLFLESAWFRPETVSYCARAYGLQSESSQRFERGVDPTLQRPAIERATALLLAIVGGQPGPVIDKTTSRHMPRVPMATLRPQRVEQILGMSVPTKRIESILKSLGMRLKKNRKYWSVTPPRYRFDVTREADLIEEIARIYGYEKVPRHRPRIEMTCPVVSESVLTESRIHSALIDRDYQEVITYSFIDPRLQASLDPSQKPIPLSNPISADMAVMRTSLWPGLLKTILYNQNRQQKRIRLFEIGRSFLKQGSEIAQEPMLGGAVCGAAMAEQWGLAHREVDFFDVKADVEALLALAGLDTQAQFTPSEHSALHPGQSADIRSPGMAVGRLGMLHPDLQAKLGLDQPVVLFELNLAVLKRTKTPKYKEISRFPSIRRDIAVIVPETTPAQAVLKCAEKAAGRWLVNLELFDEYRGKGIDSGRKSLALGLTLQDSSRTLNEDEAERVKAEVIAALGSELGAQPRQ